MKFLTEEYNADLKKWFQDEKYLKGQINSTEKYF